jgi:exopolysaccharide biosynthesis polyprenyl glycosylphosphotransferase
MGLSGTDIAAFTKARLQTSIEGARKNFLYTSQWKLLVIALILSDLFTLGLAFRAAYFVRFELRLPIFKLDVVPSLTFYLSLVAILTPCWVVIFALAGLYNRQNLLGGTQEYSLVFTSTTVGLLLIIVIGFFGPEIVVARGWLLCAWAFAFLSTSLGRFMLRRAVYYLRRTGFFLSPALIVGANEEGKTLAEQLLNWKASGLHVLGFVDDGIEPGTIVQHDLPVLGGLDKLEETIHKFHIEEIIMVTSAVTRERMLGIFKRYGLSNSVNVRLSSGLYELVTTGVQVKEVASVPLVKINKVRLAGLDKFLKNLLDYGLGIPMLVLISPLLLIIAVAIKLDSPGPVIHRRRVMGVNGKQFDAFKFRTMRIDGDAILDSHPELKAELAQNHKLKDDPRVTRLGRLLRKYSLDELPQLINVIRHEMSLVGPRMISPEEMEKYHQWGTNLLTIRPGITGLWQVSGRSDISYEERVRLDMFYIRNWTVWLDLQLLIRTLPAAIKGEGAY